MRLLHAGVVLGTSMEEEKQVHVLEERNLSQGSSLASAMGNGFRDGGKIAGAK